MIDVLATESCIYFNAEPLFFQGLGEVANWYI